MRLFLCICASAVLAAGAFQSNQFHFDPDSKSDNQFENHHNEPGRLFYWNSLHSGLHLWGLNLIYTVGFDLDLDALRLVQISLNEEAMWMTERQKLRVKAMGIKYLDM
jgi:hypothetical protein